MFLLTERELNLQKQSWDLAGSESHLDPWQKRGRKTT